MASTIILKNGTGSAIPTTLAQGEPAINVDTGLFYYGSGSVGAVKTFSNFTNITASLSASHLGGNISASGEVTAASGSFRKGINIGMLDNSIMRLYSPAVNQQHISASGKLVFNSSHFQFTNDSPLLGPSSFFRVVGDTNIIGNVTSSGNISASGVGTHILGGPLTLATSGDSVLKIMGNVTDKVEHELHGRGNVHSFLCSSSGMNLGIGNSHPTEKLTVSGSISASGDLILEGGISSSTYISTTHITASGNISVGNKIFHNGDPDTFIYLSNDDINITVGGINMVDFTEDSNDEITFNETAQDLDVRIEGEDDVNLFFTDASTPGRVGIGTKSPLSKLTVKGNIHASQSGGHITASGNISSSGFISASSFSGDGSGLSNVPATISGDTLATDLKIGRDDGDLIDFTSDNQITFRVSDGNGVVFKASGEIEATKFDGALEGNADTATALATARNIGGVSFDGTGDINLPGVNTAGDQNTTGTATNATNVVTTLNEEEHEDDYISFVDGTSGNQGVEVSRNLVYNPAKQSFQVLGTYGHITASGNISASGNVIAAEITASGAIKVEHLHSTDDVQIDDDLTVNGDINVNGNIVGDGATQLSGLTHITAIGNMAFGNHGSDSHTITGTTSYVGPININGHISSSGDISGSNIDAGGNISAVGHITASGNISSSGYISGSKIHTSADASATFFNARTKTTGYKLGGVKVLYKSGSGDVIVGQTTNKTIITGSSVVLGNNVLSHVTASGNISSSGNITADKIYFRGEDNSTEYLEHNGTGLHYKGSAFINSHITASGNISSSGNIIASNIFLPGGNKISFDDSLDGTDQFIKGTDHNIIIEGDDYVKVVVDKEFYVGTSSTLANFKVDTAGNITSSGNIVVTGSISSSRLLVTSASFGTSTIAPSSSVTIEGRLSSSGDIETEGFVYSENHEILVNGSWRAATVAEGVYAYPGNHGFMNTNWSVESGGGPPDYGNTQVGGMVIPYSCSLVGVRANVNATVGGADHTGSFTIWAEKMLQGMASTAHEPDLIFEMYMPQPEGQKNYQYSQLTGVTSSQAANYSVLTPGHILNIAYKNEAGSSHNVLGHYCILIKRIKELH